MEPDKIKYFFFPNFFANNGKNQALNREKAGKMSQLNQAGDRRRYERYGVKEGAYAALSPDSAKMGQIIDISRGGLCFRYIAHVDQIEDAAETHVFVGDEGIYLEKMPNRVIEDVPVEDGSFPGSIMLGAKTMRVMRQRRVCFGELTGNQAAQLEYFIQNRTTGLA
jgi:hypothetical protein